MKKTYMIDVDCANCAAKMEQAANTVEGIVSASVNYMALKMSVEFAEGADVKKVMGEVLKKCRKIEPDCEIYY
ncbi:MAG: cation transporter [Oscillospiraceae bacterium]|nr:cation transporter [Oscillospiraceae bacterium]